MLTINNSKTNKTNINLEDCKILSNSSIEATLDEGGKKVIINIYKVEDEFSIQMEDTINKFRIDLSGILKTFGYYFPRNGSSNFNLKITDKSGKSLDIDSSNQIIITELPKYDNLIEMTKQYLENKKGSMNPTIRSKIIYGVAATLKKLHKNGIYGCHLRNEDVFLDDNFEPKIGGFGIYKIMQDSIEKYMAIFRTPMYEIPPELYYDENGHFDVYSFAFFVYRMFSTKVLFYNNINREFSSNYQFIKSIRKGNRPTKPDNMPENYWNLIERCWDQMPESRPTIDEIVDILNDKKYGFDEIEGINIEELSEYKNRINSEGDDENNLNQHKKEILDLFIQKVENSNQNYFLDEDDEESHEMIENVGEGATSFTYKIFDHKTEKFMCKKILKYQKDDGKLFKNAKNIIKEFEVLYKLIHPCICRSYGINTCEKIEDPNMSKMKVKKEMTTVSIFLEFLSKKLSEVLKSGINNTLKTRIIIEIVHGMRHIHKKGMIHRDLKIDNIMLNDVFEAKIVDFGLVRIYEIFDSDFSYVNDSLTKGVGTFAYMSPEMLNEEDYDYKTDVYSFGVVLYAMFTGSLPKQNLKDKTNGKIINLPSSSNSISKICIDLIRKCMQPKPIDRPSFDQILSYIRQNDYKLADYVDHSIIFKRDHELELFEKYQK